MGATIDGTIVVRLLADPDAVSDFGDDRAADRAMGANILAARDYRTRGRRRAGFGSAYVAERQRAERRQTPSDEARTLQKSAPIQAACRLALQHASKCPVVDATLCPPLDQRGLSPSPRRVAVDTIELLNLNRARLVTSFALVAAVPGLHHTRLGGTRVHGCRRSSARDYSAKQIAPTDQCLEFLLHREPSTKQFRI